MPRFAANLSLMFSEHPLPDRFAAAADAGFQLVEIQFPYAYEAELLGARARAANVGVILINAPPGDFDAGERGLAGLDDTENRFIPSLDVAMRYAAELDVRLVHVMSGIGDCSAPRIMQRLKERLGLASDLLGARGITTLIEPINSHDMPGYLLGDFDRALDVIQELASPNLKLLFDVYHRQRMAGEITDALENMLPLIGHIQIAGVPGRREPVDGEINYSWLLRRIDSLGYEGVIGCEYVPRGRTEDGLVWMNEGMDNAPRLHR